MRHHARVRRVIPLAGVAFGLFLNSAEAPAQSAHEVVTPHIPRVRSLDPDITALVGEAAALSPTFRRLVDAIDASDGLVYLQAGRCPKAVPACLILAVTVSGPHRVLRVIVNRRFAETRHDLMASIGHELQHAAEVLSDPNNTTSARLFLFYRQVGYQTWWGTFETHAALRVGREVSSELNRQ